ncbi:2OG-Fe(II) oxygenase [Mycena vulgaris]|nr:2OG-Fe(II) oxygenase [Mycena vulgaris]
MVNQIQWACQTVGLFYIENHGIPEEVLHRSLSTSIEFFSLKEDTKLRDPISVNFGYRPILDSKVDPEGTRDLMEGLTLQWEEPDEIDTPNQWPEEVPALRDAVLDYYAHALSLGRVLYRLISLAMGLGEDFLAEKTKHNSSRMRLLRYPEQPREVMGTGAHREQQMFTILLQQPGIEALQIAVPSVGWTFIPPLPGTLVVKLGEQMAISTNGLFRSPLHRIVCRPGADRYSIPLFFLADFDVVLEPHESFVTLERPQQYQLMTAGERLERNVSASRVT